MQTLQVIKNKHFIGREFEQNKLKQIGEIPEASIIVVYGRRRVGKTELLEQTYGQRHLLKFEGIEGEKLSHQIKHVLIQLAHYAQEPRIAHLQFEYWVQVFELIAECMTKAGKSIAWTLYFEETQWLACYAGPPHQLKIVLSNL